MRRARTTARHVAFVLCGLSLCLTSACAGPQRPRCSPGTPDAEAAQVFPHHGQLAAHLEALADLIDDPSTEPYDVATAVDDYIQALPPGARTLGKTTLYIERQLAPADHEVFCAGSGRRVMAAREGLEQSLEALALRDDVSAAYVAHAIRAWLQRSTL